MTKIHDECYNYGYSLARGGCTLEFVSVFGPKHAEGWKAWHAENGATPPQDCCSAAYQDAFNEGTIMAGFGLPRDDAYRTSVAHVAGWDFWTEANVPKTDAYLQGRRMASEGCDRAWAQIYSREHARGWDSYRAKPEEIVQQPSRDCRSGEPEFVYFVVVGEDPTRAYLDGIELARHGFTRATAESHGPVHLQGWSDYHANEGLAKVVATARDYRLGFTLAKSGAPRSTSGVNGIARGEGWDAYHAAKKAERADVSPPEPDELTQEQCDDFLTGVSLAAAGIPRDHVLPNIARLVGWDAYQDSDGAVHNEHYRQGFRRAHEGLREVIGYPEAFIEGWSEYHIIGVMILHETKTKGICSPELVDALVSSRARKASGFTKTLRDALRKAYRTGFYEAAQSVRSVDISEEAINGRLSSLLLSTEQLLGSQSEQRS